MEETVLNPEAASSPIVTCEAHAAIAERLAKAINECAQVPLPKSGYNEHARYDYSTADDVFKVVRPIVAKLGLVPMSDELECRIEQQGDKGKVRTWAIVTYRLWWESEKGAGPSVKRTIPVQLNSTQALQAAATYALKYWLRGQLLLVTGEQDLDAEKPEKPTWGQRVDAGFKKKMEEARASESNMPDGKEIPF